MYIDATHFVLLVAKFSCWRMQRKGCKCSKIIATRIQFEIPLENVKLKKNEMRFIFHIFYAIRISVQAKNSLGMPPYNNFNATCTGEFSYGKIDAACS